MSDIEFVKVMSSSLSEFHRSYERFRPDDRIAPQQRSFEIEEGNRRLEIDLADMPPKVMGTLLQLPQLEVRFTFSNWSADERDAFFAAFDKVFQRGGG